MSTPTASDITTKCFDKKHVSTQKQGAWANPTGFGLNFVTPTIMSENSWNYNYTALEALLSCIVGEGAIPGYEIPVTAIADTLGVQVGPGGVAVIAGVPITLSIKTDHVGLPASSGPIYLFMDGAGVVTHSASDVVGVNKMLLAEIYTDTDHVNTVTTDLVQWKVSAFQKDRLIYNFLDNVLSLHQESRNVGVCLSADDATDSLDVNGTIRSRGNLRTDAGEIKGLNKETIGSTKQLLVGDPAYQYINGGTGTKIIKLPQSPATGQFYRIMNTGATDLLTIKTYGDVTIESLDQTTTTADLIYDGADWRIHFLV